MLLSEPVKITLRIAEDFERLGIRYFVSGSLASSLHGVPRATQDVDVVADIKDNHIPQLVEALESDFYIDEHMMHEAVKHRSSFNVIHLTSMFKVDIFTLKPDDASQREMARREKYQVSDDPQDTLFLASAEDVIVHKLYWFKLGGAVSERQWNDVLGVLQVLHGKLNSSYLQQASQERGVGELLTQALREAHFADFE